MSAQQITDIPSENRRQHERVPFRSSAKVMLPNQSFTVSTTDISAGGLGIIVDANPTAGIKFRIGFHLPSRNGKTMELEAIAEVMHSIFSSSENGFKVGLRFAQIDAATQNAIESYVKLKKL